MIGSLWLWGGLALALFWVVGVYNRLVRMRARGSAALRSVDKHMRQCLVLANQHATQVNVHSNSTASDTSVDMSAQRVRLLDLLCMLDQALQDANGETLASPATARVGLAFDAVQAAWSQWSSQPLDAVLPLAPDGTRLQWEAATFRAQAARAGLNQILVKYNEAIAQFPARLLVGFLGVEPAVIM